MLNMITRQQAITTLGILETSGLLSKEIQNRLADIIKCIQGEQEGVHWWGAERSDYCLARYRQKDISEKEKTDYENILLKHMFWPSCMELQNHTVNINNY
ncbi:hypothetical protein SAMN04487761_13431 [Lachnospiraceae bacterium C7]|nr:hypothetical protein SAMN04487761_13431 [Lachnospiraceae bacterium C7]